MVAPPLIPKPKTKKETLYTKPQTLNPLPKTQTLNPKPSTQNPNPKNPKSFLIRV